MKRILRRILAKAPSPIRAGVRRARHRWKIQRIQDRTKYFGIGRNKTGTTTLQSVFARQGFIVGSQLAAERFAHENYFEGEFEWLKNYGKSAEFFQDVPFSWPNTFRHADRLFPGSKFILTVRDDEHQWYDSLTRFQAQRFGGGRLPTADELRADPYVVKGYAYNTVRIHGTTDENPYDAETMKAHYLRHNTAVRAYFANRTCDLLEINVARSEDYQRLMKFIGCSDPEGSFPRMNATKKPETSRVNTP